MVANFGTMLVIRIANPATVSLPDKNDECAHTATGNQLDLCSVIVYASAMVEFLHSSVLEGYKLSVFIVYLLVRAFLCASKDKGLQTSEGREGKERWELF